jgi:hypothetical protein
MKRSIHACLLILALAPFAFAQPAQNDARELWLARAQNLTSDLLKDGADLSSMQRAILWAKLAQRWWREDPRRAREWIVNAIDAVEQVPNKETPEEHTERTETRQVLLTLVTPLDQKLAKRLLALVTDSKSPDYERYGNADALIDAAVTVVESDPKRAADIGAMALRVAPPDNIQMLLFPLRRKDPKLADNLFMQALAVAKQEPKAKLSNSLMYVAFPAQRGMSADMPVPPDSLRAELLQMYVTMITDSMADGSKLTCGVILWLAPVYSEMDRLLPKQMAVVRLAINRCQPGSPVARQVMDDATRSEATQTIESLLATAAEAQTIELRTTYKFRAAGVAQQSKDYERAQKILDDMSQEERDLMDESWTSARWDWASDGAVEYYKNNRVREMNLLLDSVPAEVQPLAKAAFIHRLPKESISEPAMLMQILNDAIAGLRRSNIPAVEKFDWYFALLPLTVKYQFADANALLKDGLAAFNQVKIGSQLNAVDPFKMLEAPLVEMDEFVVKDALASVTLVPNRVQLRLVLLNATLERLKSL